MVVANLAVNEVDNCKLPAQALYRRLLHRKGMQTMEISLLQQVLDQPTNLTFNAGSERTALADPTVHSVTDLPSPSFTPTQPNFSLSRWQLV